MLPRISSGYLINYEQSISCGYLPESNALVFEKVSCIICMASSIKTIIKHQIAWYLGHNPTEEERDLSASAPLHNIELERIVAV